MGKFKRIIVQKERIRFKIKGCTNRRERLNKGWLKKFRERVKGGKVDGKNKIGGKGILGIK